MVVGSSVLCDGVRERRRLNVQDTERRKVQRACRCVSTAFCSSLSLCKYCIL